MGEKRKRTQKEGNEAFLKNMRHYMGKKNLAQALTTKSRKREARETFCRAKGQVLDIAKIKENQTKTNS